MPRQRNPVGIAAGKLILAIQKELAEISDESEAARGQKVMDRAHTLLQASQSSSITNLLDGRSVVEYLDAVWIDLHPSVHPSVDAFVSALRVHDADRTRDSRNN